MHYSVLLQESIEALNIEAGGVYIDGTFGRGGHSRAILEKLDQTGRLLVFDKDPEAIAYAHLHFDADPRVTIVHAPFSSMLSYCQQHQLTEKIHGIVLDLGVSSPQLDEAERGFSFMRDGPLDMRMDTTTGEPVSAVLSHLSREKLTEIFRNYGEERHAWKIAGAIKAVTDQGQTIERTLQLADLIASTIGKKEKKHPATRCFQALRIYVNEELQEVERVLEQFNTLLKVGGRAAVISFHSLEDRMVKVFMNNAARGTDKELPRGLPLPTHLKPTMKWVVKQLKASSTELDENVRSRSAILRVAEKV